MPRPMYTDREYLEQKFQGIEDKLDHALQLVPRVIRLEQQSEFRTRLWNIALAITGAIGVFIGWGIDIVQALWRHS